MFITIPRACSQLYRYEKLEEKGISPQTIQEIKRTNGDPLKDTQSWHIDDGKITGTYIEVEDWIDFMCTLDREYMGTDDALEWPLGKSQLKKELLYLGK